MPTTDLLPERCSKSLCAEMTIGNTLPEKEFPTKKGTYFMAVLGTSILKNCHELAGATEAFGASSIPAGACCAEISGIMVA